MDRSFLFSRRVSYLVLLVSLVFMQLQACGGSTTPSTDAPQATPTNTQSQGLVLLRAFLIPAYYLDKNAKDINLLPPSQIRADVSDENDLVCPNGGGISGSDGSDDALFEDCNFGDFTLNGTISTTPAGTSDFNPFPISFNNLTVTSPFTDASSFVISGSLTGGDHYMNIQVTGVFGTGNDTLTASGTLTFEDNELANGSINITENTSAVASCTFNQFDLSTITCSTFATLCGLSTSLCP